MTEWWRLKCEKLEQEVERLKAEIEDLKGHWDYIPPLSKTENFIVQTLLTCSPRTMPTEVIIDRVEQEFGRDTNVNTIKKQIHDARKKIDRYRATIRHVYFHGYVIDAVSKQRLLAVMAGQLAA